MRIAPISNYYVNYNRVNSQYKQKFNVPKAEYSYATPVFTSKKHPSKPKQGPRNAEIDLKTLRYMKVKIGGDYYNRWLHWNNNFDKIVEIYQQYPNETMELATLKIGDKEYMLDSDFIEAATPYWKKHSGKVKDYLTHHGYNDYSYHAQYLKPFMETYINDPKTMRKFLNMRNNERKFRFYSTGVTALTSNYKDLKKEIDRFVYLKQDDGITYFVSNGESIVDYAKSYKNSPVNAERILQLRNYNGKIVFSEGLLKAYDEYPEKFEEFLKVTKTNKNLKRFKDLWAYAELVPAYAKCPDKLEEFAKKKYPGRSAQYRFNESQVAELAEASVNYYNEIIQAMNTEKWNKPYRCCSKALIDIAKVLKEHPDVIPEFERIDSLREDNTNFGYICHHIDSYLKNPEAFSKLATTQDSDNIFLNYGNIEMLIPEYTNNPQLRTSINSNNFSWESIIKKVLWAESS